MINKQLAEDRGISEEDQLHISILHSGREDIFEASRKVVSPEMQRELFSDWLDVERTLQMLWGFDEEDRFIKFWTFPACSCPSMDNEDAFPTGYYYVNGDCIIHGTESDEHMKEVFEVSEEHTECSFDGVGGYGSSGRKPLPKGFHNKEKQDDQDHTKV